MGGATDNTDSQTDCAQCAPMPPFICPLMGGHCRHVQFMFRQGLFGPIDMWVTLKAKEAEITFYFVFAHYCPPLNLPASPPGLFPHLWKAGQLQQKKTR